MDISRALTIPGYMSRLELEWLANRASEHKVIIEIGSLAGRSSVAMALNTKGTIYCVDNFYDLGENYDASHHDEAKQRFLDNTKGIDNIVILERNHEDFGPIHNADFVFIDGSHLVDDVRRDIKKWLNCKNLLLAGHDWGEKKHPGVKQAVTELLPSYEIVWQTTLWWTQL